MDLNNIETNPDICDPVYILPVFSGDSEMNVSLTGHYSNIFVYTKKMTHNETYVWSWMMNRLQSDHFNKHIWQV